MCLGTARKAASTRGSEIPRASMSSATMRSLWGAKVSSASVVGEGVGESVAEAAGEDPAGGGVAVAAGPVVIGVSG